MSTHSLSSQDALCLPTHLSSQVVACGQVLEAVQAIPVASSSTARVMVDHLREYRGEAGVRLSREGKLNGRRGTATLGRWLLDLLGPLAREGNRGEVEVDLPPPQSEGRRGKGGAQSRREGLGPGHRSRALTSTSQRALELVAEVADWRSVVRRKTCSLPLYSSHVRNFSCSAWNSRTTSPCRRQGVGSGKTKTLPGANTTCLGCRRSWLGPARSCQSQQAEGEAHAEPHPPEGSQTPQPDPKFRNSRQLRRDMLLPRAFPSLPCWNLPLSTSLPSLYL